MFEVWDRALSVDAVMKSVEHAGAGGVALFVGVVRDHNDGRAVTKLEYEAYDAMAVAEMTRIGDEIAQEFEGIRLAALHRKGSLTVGELAVVCAASAVHRGEAFDACRKLIDAIKARVPIWKREWGPEGPYWIHWEDARCTPDHHLGDAHAHHGHKHHHHG